MSRHEEREALYPECVTNYIAQDRHLNRKEGQVKEMNGKYTKSLKSQTMWKLKARESATCGQMQRKNKRLQVIPGFSNNMSYSILITSNRHIFLSSLNTHLIHLNKFKWNNCISQFLGYICQEHLCKRLILSCKISIAVLFHLW